ncbi:hypothetical protein OCF68_24695 [Bacillus cereus]|nr:hypothetical protein [Bacillus cereus]MDA2480422.1 hypothetical protein [Bacillus cereus]MDA2497477.1 hypothetical protein [Bacillus cereus]OON42440.1 hypothetical protein BU230_19670 [Klebsiella pneumoniae]
MGPNTVKLHLVNGESVLLKGEIVQGLYKGFHKGTLSGITLITDSTNNITYNMANVIKLEWI